MPSKNAAALSQLEQISRQKDSLHGVSGIPARLGSYIVLKSSPNISHIVIKKGVQQLALKRLSQHIIGEAKEHPTRLRIKRTKKGKYSYDNLFSAMVLRGLTVEHLIEKLKQLMKRRTELHILLQPLQPGGKMYKMISQGISLI
jgi:hypothetical protein